MSLVDPIAPLLWQACLGGDVLSMENMMARGADPHLTDRNGETCLHMTARSGEVGALERILQDGVELDRPNNNGQTPLHVAVHKDHTDMVKGIVRNGADLDLTTKFSGMTGLHLACTDNNVDMVRYLLDSGANCAIHDKIQKYPDFYTSNKAILSTFDDHFEVCTHGRRQSKKTADSPIMDDNTAAETIDLTTFGDSSGTVVINDDNEVKKAKSQAMQNSKRKGNYENHPVDRDRTKLQYEDRDHTIKPIHDKMEKYDVTRGKQNWNLIKRDTKKLKINHATDFSDEHKRRMQQNVFDRLLHSKKPQNK